MTCAPPPHRGPDHSNAEMNAITPSSRGRFVSVLLPLLIGGDPA